ncbi:MAG: alpha-L-fucosidase [Cellulosilyticaceae bacterium]
MTLVKEKRIAEFEEMAYGMFIHWGLYSQLGKGEWVQCMHGIPLEKYMPLKDTFTAEDFDAKAIAKLAKRAGMKYITLTTRHHDGFSLYDTKGLNDYDAVHSPAGRDLIAEFVEACREEGIMPFFYHTTLDWYRKDFNEDFDSYLEYLRQSVEILCTQYGPIGGLWFDGNWSKPGADWKLDELYGTIRKHQPEAMIINNTGLEAQGRLGHPEIDSVTFEQGVPEPIDRTNMEKYISGEMCCTLNDHWGVGANDLNYKTPAQLIKTLCKCRRAGANLLLNIGPDAQGGVPNMMSATLEVIGDWLKVFGESIHQGRPANIVGDGENFGLITEDGKRYLFIFDLPIVGHENVTVGNGRVRPQTFTGMFGEVKSVKWMDNGRELPFVHDGETGMFTVNPTGYEYGTNFVVRVAVVE